MVIKNAKDVVSVMRGKLADLDHEECWCLFLDNSNVVLQEKMMTIGSLDSVVMDKRRIIKNALNFNAIGIIVLHNHVSHNCMPSQADIKMTEELKACCDVFELRLMDHIVFAKDSYYSFHEEEVKPYE